MGIWDKLRGNAGKPQEQKVEPAKQIVPPEARKRHVFLAPNDLPPLPPEQLEAQKKSADQWSFDTSNRFLRGQIKEFSDRSAEHLLTISRLTKATDEELQRMWKQRTQFGEPQTEKTADEIRASYLDHERAVLAGWENSLVCAQIALETLEQKKNVGKARQALDQKIAEEQESIREPLAEAVRLQKSVEIQNALKKKLGRLEEARRLLR